MTNPIGIPQTSRGLAQEERAPGRRKVKNALVRS
jgi:hypothetical protein